MAICAIRKFSVSPSEGLQAELVPGWCTALLRGLLFADMLGERVVLSRDEVSAGIAAARRGDEAAWHRLFGDFHYLVWRYCFAHLGDHSSADDLAQEVFVAAVKAIGRLRDESRPGIEGWLLGIARNKVADRFRQSARERKLQVIRPELEADPAEIAVRRLTVERLRACLNTLPQPQRDIVIRRFVLDQSLEHVARVTGRRIGAVKALQHRAVAALNRRWRQSGDA
jgi:RNA polymerase sigma-70 factor (ECF subfamily)